MFSSLLLKGPDFIKDYRGKDDLLNYIASGSCAGTFHGAMSGTLKRHLLPPGSMYKLI